VLRVRYSLTQSTTKTTLKQTKNNRGIELGKVEIAKNLIKLGLNNDLIEQGTGLTIEQIEVLRKTKD
jgi:hypothetical protein